MFQLMTLGKKLKIFSYDEAEEIQRQVDSRINKLKKSGYYSQEAFKVLEKLLVV